MAQTWTLSYAAGEVPPGADPLTLGGWEVGTWGTAQEARETLIEVVRAYAASVPGAGLLATLSALLEDLRAGRRAEVRLGVYTYALRGTVDAEAAGSASVSGAVEAATV